MNEIRDREFAMGYRELDVFPLKYFSACVKQKLLSSSSRSLVFFLKFWRRSSQWCVYIIESD